MGSVNNNFLPASQGLSLGNQNQRWNSYLQTLDVAGSIAVSGTASLPSQGLSTVAFSATPVFDGTSAGTFKITLTGNVTSSTYINFLAGYRYTFIIKQDVSGAHTFAWPSGFNGAMVIDGTASITNIQEFVYDGSSLYAVSAGVSM